MGSCFLLQEIFLTQGSNPGPKAGLGSRGKRNPSHSLVPHGYFPFQGWKNNEGADFFSVGGRYRNNWSSVYSGGFGPVAAYGSERTSYFNFTTISSSVIPFSSCLQSFPASGSFQMSQFFTSGGQRIGVSASTSVLPMNTQD